MSDDLNEIGEFGLIRRLLERLPAGEVLVGPGDDAAVLSARDGTSTLATADLLVEGRHFDLAFSSARDVGYKSIAVNASDIAAMGGHPLYALVSLGCPQGTSVTTMESLYDGIAEAARAFGVTIAGGDTVSSDEILVSVAMLGEAERPVLRSGARAGDVLCVTGELGGAAAGLQLLRAAAHDPEAPKILDRYPNLAEAHRRGRARVREGIAAAQAGIGAMIDVSDGLEQDASHLAEASRCGLAFSKRDLPIAEGVADVAAWLGEELWTLAGNGGDDYELAMAVSPARVEDVRAAVAPTILTVVGSFISGEIEASSRAAGWDHFR